MMEKVYIHANDINANNHYMLDIVIDMTLAIPYFKGPRKKNFMAPRILFYFMCLYLVIFVTNLFFCLYQTSTYNDICHKFEIISFYFKQIMCYDNYHNAYTE